MRGLAITALLIVLALSPAFSETVKVLILDGNFAELPEAEEKLAMLDKINGSLATGDYNYSGELEVWRGDKGIYLINELPLEEYVAGVVKAETARDWGMEALKAQAVVVRTYVLNAKKRNMGRRYHVTSSVLHQVYKGVNSDSEVSSAVEATKGEILTYGGEPIAAFYHSTCGGKTEDPEEAFGTNYPYIKPVVSNCTLSPYSMWARSMPLEEIGKATGMEGLKDIRIVSRTVTGRAKTIALETGGKKSTVPATEFRKALGWKTLPSTDFNVRVEDGTASFDGRGYGHGVGLCQWSSHEMAKEGATYREILSHFYPGATLESYEAKGL